MNIKKCSSNDDEKADSPNDSNPNDEKENLTESIQRAYQLSHTWWLCEPSSFQSAAAAVLCSFFCCCTMNIIKWVCGNLREKIERVWVPSIDRTMTKAKSTWIWCWFVKQKCLLQFTIALSFVLSWQVENRQKWKAQKKINNSRKSTIKAAVIKIETLCRRCCRWTNLCVSTANSRKKYALNKRSF